MNFLILVPLILTFNNMRLLNDYRFCFLSLFHFLKKQFYSYRFYVYLYFQNLLNQLIKFNTLYLIFPLVLVFNTVIYSQSYLGYTKEKAFLRNGPGKEFTALRILKKGEIIFIISKRDLNKYFNVIDIKSNTEGYIHKSLIEIDKEMKPNKKGIFYKQAVIDNQNVEIGIYNNTDRDLTLKLNSFVYYFEPHEIRSILPAPGTYNYRASARNVIPNIGIQNLEKGYLYIWEFYIVEVKY